MVRRIEEPMTRESKQDYTRRIAAANRTQLVIILYDMLLCYLHESKENLLVGREGDFSESIRKARGCVNELMMSLNLEYELASNLMQLYCYSIRRLAHIQLRHDEEAISQLEHMIGNLADAYTQAAAADTSSPVMDNSQTVYAGLTYGKSTLTENMTDPGTDMGFRI
jgi:flagellar protein FliS